MAEYIERKVLEDAIIKLLSELWMSHGRMRCENENKQLISSRNK